MALSTEEFILRDLNRTAADGAFCFSYTPVDQGIVHNANVLGASLLIRLRRYVADARLQEAAMASLTYTMRCQHDDGAWYYADRKRQRWIDSFHTGFVLMALRYFLNEGVAQQYRQAYEEGIQYYVSHFFLTDGTPKYYSDRTYPIDIHSPAVAVAFLSKLGHRHRALTERVLAWMLQNMWDPRGYFYFRKHRYYTNKISYLRWSQAWAFHALTEYQFQQKQEQDEDADEVTAKRD